jgi:uncharacterized SAM-binding protein YcdF (DUF218 family)
MAYFFIILAAWVPLAWLLESNLAVEKKLEKADAILVLSGSDAYIERTQEAAQLFKKGIAPQIFLTNDGLRGGWFQNEQRNPYFVERARWELVRQGVPEQSIETLSNTVEGTTDEANLFVRTAAERKLKSVLLVTSIYHSRRTLWTFERARLRSDVSLDIGIQSPPTGQQNSSPSMWWLSGRGWRMVGLEYLKIVYYRLVY